VSWGWADVHNDHWHAKLYKLILVTALGESMPLRKKGGKIGSSASLNKGSNSTLNAGEEDWKAVQLRVFTNWVNDKLRSTDVHVKKLTKELGNGVLLIKLLEVLSGKKIPGK
jgi:hypothetical protein